MTRSLPQIDTSTSRIIASTGEAFAYRLETKRRWNVGARKHLNELTGRIVLMCRDSMVISDNWPDLLNWAEIYAKT